MKYALQRCSQRLRLNFHQKVNLTQLSLECGYQLTFVYVILNTRNNLIKIGKSKLPNYREITLQSEEPEIELLFAYAVPSDFDSASERDLDE